MAGEPEDTVAEYISKLLNATRRLTARVDVLEQQQKRLPTPPLPFSQHNPFYNQTINYPARVTAVNSALRIVTAERMIPVADPTNLATPWVVNPRLQALAVSVPENVDFPELGTFILATYLGNSGVSGHTADGPITARYGLFSTSVKGNKAEIVVPTSLIPDSHGNLPGQVLFLNLSTWQFQVRGTCKIRDANS